MRNAIESELSPQALRLLSPDRLIVRVQSISYQGDELNEYRLVSTNGEELPAFTAGSHIDIYFRDGRTRQYSLCGDEWHRDSYRIVVQREQNGKGGSRDIFEKVHVGRQLVISQPRNNFRLVAADKYILIAGGIGITPIFSMAQHLAEEGKPFTLHYCTRSKERTALLSEIQHLCPEESLHIYHDGGNPQHGVDLDAVLSEAQHGTHLYYCGPPGLMQAIARKSEHWPAGHVHAEFFAAPVAPAEASNNIADTGFDVIVNSTQQKFLVPADKSILEVLKSNGYDIPSSCEAGVCGTCSVQYIDGVPDHRDFILQDEEKAKNILICCSRSFSRTLTLDL